jgi:Zn-dependent peptidase ImmA (M78 family)/DNA-binding XRE family transcriptional regulator
MFNPTRLTFARKRRGFTMTRLAKAINVQVRSVSGFENKEFNPSEDTIQRIATALRFPLSFFYEEEDIQTIDIGAASFRSLSKMTAAQRDMALYSGALTVMLNRAIEKRFKLPAPTLPDLRDCDPEAAAASLRRHWGIGEMPIKNLIHLLEANGVRVFSLAIDAAEVDAFSMWREQKPFVFLNTMKNGERSRFDAAHELGHLVIHRHGSPNGGQEIEMAANDFASAFLMPRSSVLSYAQKFYSIDVLLKLKKLWGVSISALTYRLHKLELLSEWQCRELFIQISQRGYRQKEPDSVPRETSQVLAKVFSALRSEGVGKSDIANELHLSTEDLDQMVFGLVLAAVKHGLPQEIRPNRSKPDLYLVR